MEQLNSFWWQLAEENSPLRWAFVFFFTEGFITLFFVIFFLLSARQSCRILCCFFTSRIASMITALIMGCFVRLPFIPFCIFVSFSVLAFSLSLFLCRSFLLLPVSAWLFQFSDAFRCAKFTVCYLTSTRWTYMWAELHLSRSFNYFGYANRV